MTASGSTRTLPEPAGSLAAVSPAVLADAAVLVVDDNEMNVALFERVLRAAGVKKIHTLMDSRYVVSYWKNLQPDLLLLDLHMPYMDGYEVLAALQAALPPDVFLPIIVVTADPTTAARERALGAGAKDFLTKPFDNVEIIQRVRNLLETAALYRAVREHNITLRAELERRTDQERRLAAQHRERRNLIEQALRSDALSMVFQPIFHLSNQEIVGVEALARFDAEPRRPPNEWFADAADVGLGPELELAAVHSALSQLRRLLPSHYMSVNVSPAAVLRPELETALQRVAAERVVVELTEHSPVEDYPPLLAALDRCRACGARVAVDDAGAGYAGLQRLLHLAPDLIKLDLDLTQGIDADPVRRALARSLVAFADEIGATIVAEGIETAGELTAVAGLGVHLGQGYHLGRPRPLQPHDP